MTYDQKFRKDERLCSQKLIDDLFLRGNSFYKFPFRLVWLPSDKNTIYPAQIAISVRKKQFKRAVDRNRIKRRIREAYRKNKSELYTELERLNLRIAFMIIYTAPEIMEYTEIEGKIILILKRLKEDLTSSSA